MISRTFLQMTWLPAGLRARAARGLRGNGATANTRALVNSLGDRSELVKDASLESLVSTGAAGASALISEAAYDSSVVRTRIAAALGRFGSFPQAIRALTGLLRDSSASVRTAAANSLGETGIAATSAVELLTQTCKESDNNTAVAAVKALGRIDANGSSLPVLISQMGHNERSMRAAVIEAVGAIVSSGKARFNARALTIQLLPMFTHRDAALREAAAQVCAAMGPAANEAIPELMLLSRDMTVGVRLAAANALTAVAPGDPQTFPILIAMTQDKEWSIREIATRGFIGFGSAAKNAVPRLKGLLSDEYVRVRIAAIEAMVAIGHSARYLFDDLYIRLFDKHEDTRRAALSAFRKMAPSLREFIPVLIQEIQSNEVSRRLASIEVVKEFGDHAVDVMPHLMNCENDSSLEIRRAVAALTG